MTSWLLGLQPRSASRISWQPGYEQKKGRDAIAAFRFLNDRVYCSPPETFAPHKALAPHKAFAPHRALLPHTPPAPQSAFAPQGSFAPHKALLAPTLLFAVMVAVGAPARNSCDPQTTVVDHAAEVFQIAVELSVM